MKDRTVFTATLSYKTKMHKIWAVLLILFFLGSLPSILWAQGTSSPSDAEIEARTLIRNLFKDGFTDFAFSEAKDYLVNYPKGSFRDEALIVLAQIHSQKSEHQKASKLYDDLLKNHPQSAFVEEALFLAGVGAVASKKWVAAKAYLGRLEKEYPASNYLQKASFPLAQALFYLDRFDEAKKRFEFLRTEKSLPEKQDLQAEMFLAWIDDFQGRSELAEKRFAALLKSDLDSQVKAQIVFRMGVMAFEKGRFSDAADFFSQLRLKWRDQTLEDQSLFYLAESIYRVHQKNPQAYQPKELMRAIGLFEQNLALENPKEPALSHYHKGLLLADLKKEDQAEKEFSLLQTKFPEYAQDAELVRFRASYFIKSKNRERAVAILEQGLSLQSDPKIKSQLAFELVQNLFALDRCGDLLDNLRKLRAGDLPDKTEELAYYQGKCSIQKKDWQAALDSFGNIDPASPYFSPALADYLLAAQKAKQPTLGIEVADKGLMAADKKQKIELLLIKAEFQTETRQYEAALDSLNEVLTLDPAKQKSPDFLIHLAGTHDKLSTTVAAVKKSHHKDKAAEYYLKALELLPEDQKDTRLAIIERLITHATEKKDAEKLLWAYGQSLGLLDEGVKKDQILFEMAQIQLDQLKNPTQAQRILLDLHNNKTRSELYFKASNLLAEIAISKKQFSLAIEVLHELSEKVGETSGWYPKTQFRLAELYHAQEDWKKALKHYQEAANKTKDASVKQKAQKAAASIETYLKSNP